MQKDNEIKLCPECGSSNLIHDFDTKETTCLDCGLVIKESVPVPEPIIENKPVQEPVKQKKLKYGRTKDVFDSKPIFPEWQKENKDAQT